MRIPAAAAPAAAAGPPERADRDAAQDQGGIGEDEPEPVFQRFWRPGGANSTSTG